MNIAGAAIDSSTQLYGVIGDPIRHSKSPVMLNRAFAHTGHNAVYLAFHIARDQLEAFVNGVRAMGIRGVNVTIPHKQAVMPFLDELDVSARLIGAVNTIVNDQGRLIGYNTDGIGYVRSLKEEVAPDLTNRRIVLLGAGGAARGILYALSREHPAEVRVFNRSPERAAALAADFQQHVPVRPLDQEELQAACGEADLVINTTSVGMHPAVAETPVDVAWLRPETIASDLIYNPLQTRFLAEAHSKGCTTHGGLGMFIYQGAYAFEYWTGLPAPVFVMREAVVEALSI